MKNLRVKEGSRAINLKCNFFIADILTYAALVIESICEEYGIVPKVNKTIFLEDIVSSQYHNYNLVYAFLENTIDVKEAYDLGIAIKYFVTYETFYFNELVNEEIKSIRNFFSENMNEIKYNYFNSKHNENIEKYSIKAYQVGALINLQGSLDNIKEDALNNEEIIYDESIGFWGKYEEIILEYLYRLVIGSIDNAQYYDKNPMHNYYLDTIKNFYKKDNRVLTRVIINVIRHVYIKKEVKQENDAYCSDKNFNRLQNVLLDYISDYIIL